ncbi:MFS transporter [Blastococcus deserti]|uniref:MFS transporter n=1 Tax=Blastococcus deserti TaxID=2259033 RepID=A0ABW4XJ41_9ACTN
MLTTEFVVAGLLPEIAGDLQVSVAQAGLLITVFGVGMVVGAPTMALLTRRMPRRTTLVLALVVFAVGHLVVAVGSSFALLLAARFVTAFATGAFWAVASVAATRAAGPGASAPGTRAGRRRRNARQRPRGCRSARSPANCRAGEGLLGPRRPGTRRRAPHRAARPPG